MRLTAAGRWLGLGLGLLLLAGPLAGAIGARHGQRGPLVAGMLQVAIGSAGIAMWHEEPWQPALWFILCGVGIGFAFAVMPKLIVDAVKPTETGVATGMNTVVRTVGGVVGAQVGAVLLAASAAPGSGIPAESGFTEAFWIGAAGALVAAVFAMLVGPRRTEPRPGPVRTPRVVATD